MKEREGYELHYVRIHLVEPAKGVPYYTSQWFPSRKDALENLTAWNRPAGFSTTPEWHYWEDVDHEVRNAQSRKIGLGLVCLALKEKK
jgi:hypothetical protein